MKTNKSIKFNLQTNGTIGICSPSGPCTKKELEPAIQYLKSHGFNIKLPNNIFAKDRYLAGNPKDRATDFHQLIKDKKVNAIFAARGGFGSTQILDLLDYELIKKNKKPLFGFSDTTALQLALYTKTRLPSITGIALCFDIKKDVMNKTTLKHFENILSNNTFPEIVLKNESKSKEAHGILIGGCLTLLVGLMGTPYFPDLKNKILFIEDVTEEPYSIDRLLSQLLLAKNFKNLSAIVLGNFYKCKAENKKHGTINQVLKSFIARCPIPVFSNLPYGHQPARILLPIGTPAEITKNNLTFS